MQWPIPQFPTKVVNGLTTTLRTSDTANAKHNWYTLLSGLPGPASWICLASARDLNNGDRAYLMDLAIGGTGSETIVAENLVVGYRGYQPTIFPLHVPAGATIRGRISGQLTATFMDFRVSAFMSEPESGVSTVGKIATYGAVPSTSGGTPLSPAGSQNVKGSWAQLTAATTQPIHGLMVLASGSTSSQPGNLEYAIDIAVGSSGSETIIIPDHCVRVEEDEYVRPFSPEYYPLSMSIPAGVRLAARCANRNSSHTTQVEVAVYGFTF